MQLERAWTVYAGVLLAENRSERTVTRYEVPFRAFLAYLAEQRIPPTLEALTPANVRGYAAWLRLTTSTNPITGTVRRRSANTVAQYVANLKTAAAFLTEEYPETFAANPLGRLKPPQAETLPVHPLGQEQVQAILYQADRGRARHRDTALLLFLLDTGVRVEELVTVRLHSDGQEPALDLAYTATQGRAFIRGKGKKRRWVYFEHPTRRAVERYLHTAPKHGGRPLTRSPYLFLTEDGASLTTDAVRRELGRLAKRAGIAERVHPHRFRHTFATNYLRNHRGDVVGLMKQLGHSRIQTTMIYLDFVEQDLAAGHAIGSPVLAWGLGGRRRGERAGRAARANFEHCGRWASKLPVLRETLPRDHQPRACAAETWATRLVGC